MSGSEGADYITFRGAGSGGGGSSDRNECSGLKKTKSLQNSDYDVVSLLAVGDILELRLGQDTKPVVVVVLRDGDIIGAVIPDQQLVSCLELGFLYQARVQTINGGQVDLIVTT
ncbi:hypothetical protein [Clavibacter michiganensis]|uniref:hypothetical protein n=1 Tax=Clavibacter michiganensis TaxID=28447 RepID=UPI0026DB40B2|nr:hypothetical protein [Clavibacter michiganensis]MDO4027416.1 hypothetical protein [Clavibacter michiganensis]MDO4065469.1 hypothetical protein [Clavibacter michiganensis]MDO4070768.1 hypothetical protein [Clavibacter michiganensis]MDO4089188.1 hypothetical protein [Clavibacter michiganensis]